MYRFRNTIDTIDYTDPKTWKNRAFLTFDIDWAVDDILRDLHSLLMDFDVKSTWFATHESSFLTEMTGNSSVEIGIHPNFNDLLDGRNTTENYASRIANLLGVFPDAKSVRSHSITQSGPIQNAFAKNNITHDSNDFVPHTSGIKLRPWKINCGLTKVPYCWADEHHFEDKMRIDPHDILRSAQLAVFDFHPIHVFLNTEHHSRYENTRSIHKEPHELIKHRYNGYGTRSRLIDLLKWASAKGR